MKIMCCVLFLFVASASTDTLDSFPTYSDDPNIDRFVWDGAVFLKDSSLENLRKLPGLKNESTKREPNTHNPAIETEYKTFEYDGLRVYGFVREGSLALITVTVSKSKWEIAHGLNVGAPFNRVRDVLGKPQRTKDNVHEYCGETECVMFNVTGSKISEIHFRHYAD